MSTPARPNFFLLLDLDPQAAWDQATFEQRLRQKRIEWSRQSGGVARKALVARQNLALISKMQEIMTDPLLREREANMALAELATAHQAACEQFEKQLALLNAKDAIEQEEIARFIVAFQHLYSAEEIRTRLRTRNVSIERNAGKPAQIFDATMARSIADRLNFLRLRTLYELLQMPDKTATDALYRVAEQLYTRLVALPPTAEITARMELVGLACEVFKTEEARLSYDEYLRQESFSRLFKDLEESVRRSNRQELHQGQVQIFLEQARKEGWAEQEALAKLKEQARQHQWTIMVPNVRNLTYHDLGSVLRLRWEWPQGSEEVLLSSHKDAWSGEHGLPATTVMVKHEEYELHGYYDLVLTERHDLYVVISTLMKLGDAQFRADGVWMWVRLVSKAVITYEIKRTSMMKRALHLLVEPDRQLPALLLVQKQGGLPLNKADGMIFQCIEETFGEGKRKVIDLSLAPLPPNTFGKLFFRDDIHYDEFTLHHPGEQQMRLS